MLHRRSGLDAEGGAGLVVHADDLGPDLGPLGQPLAPRDAQVDRPGVGLRGEVGAVGDRLEAIGGIVTGAIPYTLTIDTACKVTGEPTFSDEDGVQCIEWDMQGFYDTTWATATAITVINAIATL